MPGFIRYYGLHVDSLDYVQTRADIYGQIGKIAVLICMILSACIRLGELILLIKYNCTTGGAYVQKVSLGVCAVTVALK